jgi:hypothetical protein
MDGLAEGRKLELGREVIVGASLVILLSSKSLDRIFLPELPVGSASTV